MTDYEYTDLIPVCPVCKKGTQRIRAQISILDYRPKIYDAKGKPIKIAYETPPTQWRCLDCGETYYA